MNKPLKFLIFTIALCGVSCYLVVKQRLRRLRLLMYRFTDPDTRRDLCTIPTLTGDPVDFTAYVTNVSLNPTTGVISWDIGLGYRSCRLEATRAYAIYGDSDICPQSGWYGAAGAVYDCVKYVGNPIYSGASSLNCLEAPRQWKLYNRYFWFGFSGRAKPWPGHIEAIAMTHQLPNWAAVRKLLARIKSTGRCVSFIKLVPQTSIYLLPKSVPP